MKLKSNLLQQLSFLFFFAILTGLISFAILFWLAAASAQAAPPPQPDAPIVPVNQASLTITATKTSDPSGLVDAGDTVTFTIAFKSDIAGTLVVTDPIPAMTGYKAGTISGLAATTTNIITPDDTDPNLMAWTVENNVPNTLINLSFAVLISSLAPTGTQIVNVAWLSDTNDITTTAPVTLTVSNPVAKAFLPIILQGSSLTGTTQLFIESINTGGLSLVEVRTVPDDQLVLVCGIGNNTTGLCGTVPAGQYAIIMTTLNCGQLKTIEIISGDQHTVTSECLTLPQTTQLYLQTSNTGGDTLVEVRTDPGNSLVLSCTVGDNTTGLCGTLPPGDYTITANTPNCGPQTVTTSLSGSQVTVPISCGPTITTQVYIETSNTGGISTIEIRTLGSNTLERSCAIPDETTQLCGSVSAGTYRVLANTANCGQIVAPSLLITGTQQTIPVSCTQLNDTWIGRLGTLPVE